MSILEQLGIREPTDTISTAACCGRCAKYIRDENNPGHGRCDNWAGVDLSEGDVCNPYMGTPIMKEN